MRRRFRPFSPLENSALYFPEELEPQEFKIGSNKSGRSRGSLFIVILLSKVAVQVNLDQVWVESQQQTRHGLGRSAGVMNNLGTI